MIYSNDLVEFFELLSVLLALARLINTGFGDCLVECEARRADEGERFTFPLLFSWDRAYIPSCRVAINHLWVTQGRPTAM